MYLNLIILTALITAMEGTSWLPDSNYVEEALRNNRRVSYIMAFVAAMATAYAIGPTQEIIGILFGIFLGAAEFYSLKGQGLLQFKFKWAIYVPILRWLLLAISVCLFYGYIVPISGR